jgi:hypothetical protein
VDDSVVIQWIPYAEADSHEENGLGGMGGWFHEGLRWSDYLDQMGLNDPANNRTREYAESFRVDVVKCNIRHGADWHQHGPAGVPLFADGTIATFSYRAWGDILAAIWSTADDKNYSYMDFYMCGFGANAHDEGCTNE